MMKNRVIEVHNEGMEPPKIGSDLFDNRASIAAMQQTALDAEVSVIVQAYNGLEKTKRCVESVLKYTADVDYELILIDNGSQDGTLEYFRTVPYEKKRIVHISKNIGASYPNSVLNLNELGRFICHLASDLIVTHHWLKNLLTCMKSDCRIGMVNAVSSNTSNLQEVPLEYRTAAEMQEKARAFNCSDPRKWEDRLRLITLGTLYRKEAIMAVGWPIGDVGFFHDFVDDDITFRMRRMGYRTVLAGDTWICHDHDFRNWEGKDPVQFQQSVEIGGKNFQEKYFGIDAWQDVNNYYLSYMDHFPRPEAGQGAHILGIDVKCGTPILDVKNWLRKQGIFDAELSAYTQDPKYWIDLKTICQGTVSCDREEFLTDAYPQEYFDYVIADRPLNRYHEPQKMINDLFSLCKSGGVVTCKLKNTFSFQEYVHLLGQWEVYDQEFAYDIPLDAFAAALKSKGTVEQIVGIPFSLSEDQQQALEGLLPADLPSGQRQDLLNRMMCEEYLVIVKKHSERKQ